MNKTQTAALIFLFPTCIFSILLYLNISYHNLQLIALLLLMVILVIFEYKIRKTGSESARVTNYAFLFLITCFVELLVVSTGGVGSHFLLLASLFILALSFLITIQSALIFLILFFSLLGFQIYLDQNIQAVLVADPANWLLMVLTFVIVGSLAIILNEYYHLKDVFVEVLKKKVYQKEFHEQSVLSNLTELIIITDLKLNIVSVNEAVEQALSLAKSELLKKNLFKVLLLKDETNAPLNADIISLTKLQSEPFYIGNIHLSAATGKNENRFTLTVKPILDLDGKLYQLIVILRKIDLADNAWKDDSHILDQIVTKQQAMIEDIRLQLAERGINDLVFKAALVGKLDREVRSLIDLKSNSDVRTETVVDVMRVVENTYEVLKSFADKVHVKLELTSNIQSERERKNLAAFLAQVDLLWFDVLIHKLMEIAILLSSSSSDKHIVVSVQQNSDSIMVIMKSSYNQLDVKDIKKLFALNFEDLQSRTNLERASGLEGYIAHQISERINLPIITNVAQSGTEFILKLNRAREK